MCAEVLTTLDLRLNFGIGDEQVGRKRLTIAQAGLSLRLSIAVGVASCAARVYSISTIPSLSLCVLLRRSA